MCTVSQEEEVCVSEFCAFFSLVLSAMPGVQIGQNTAYYYKDFKDAVDAWAEEKKHLRFKVGFYGGAAANYSQVSW